MVITLAEYKTYAGINSGNQDEKLTILVAYVNEFIEKFCSTKFTSTSVERERAVVTMGSVVLSNAPLLGVDYIITKNNVVINDFFEELEQGIVSELDDYEGQTVYIDYSYGTTKAPAGLKMPAIELVTYFSKREFNQSQSIGSTGENINFSDTKTIPAHIRAALELYRVL